MSDVVTVGSSTVDLAALTTAELADLHHRLRARAAACFGRRDFGAWAEKEATAERVARAIGARRRTAGPVGRGGDGDAARPPVHRARGDAHPDEPEGSRSSQFTVWSPTVDVAALSTSVLVDLRLRLLADAVVCLRERDYDGLAERKSAADRAGRELVRRRLVGTS